MLLASFVVESFAVKLFALQPTKKIQAAQGEV
jgi:hypothetical protein